MRTGRAVERAHASVALAAAFARAGAPRVLGRVVPAYVALGLVSAVIFGGNGLRPRDVVGALAVSAPARVVAFGSWLALTAPAAGAVVRPPGTDALRSLPAPRAALALAVGIELVVLAAPFAGLFALGRGVGAGGAVALSTAALSAFAAVPPKRLVERAALALLAVAIVLGASPMALLEAAAVASPFAFAGAAARGAEPSPSARTGRLSPARWAALAHAELAVVMRRDRGALLRAAALCLLAATALAVALRNGDAAPRSRVATVLLAAPFPLALAVGGLGGRVLETERRLEWLLSSLGTTATLRAWSATIATATLGAIGGAILGGATAALADDPLADAVRVVALVTLVGAYIGTAAAISARRGQRATGIDGATLVVGTTAGAASAMACVGLGGPETVLLLLPGATALGALAPRWLARRERTTEWSSRPMGPP
jgi:hypothetical protein